MCLPSGRPRRRRQRPLTSRGQRWRPGVSPLPRAPNSPAPEVAKLFSNQRAGGSSSENSLRTCLHAQTESPYFPSSSVWWSRFGPRRATSGATCVNYAYYIDLVCVFFFPSATHQPISSEAIDPVKRRTSPHIFAWGPAAGGVVDIM